MSKIRSLPYLTPLATRLEFDDWHTTQTDGGGEPLARVLPDWDPAVTIAAEAVVTLDIPHIFDDCHLQTDAELRLACIWESRGSGLKGRGSYWKISYSEQRRIFPLSLQIEGINLAKEIDLGVLLILVNSGETPQPFAPKLSGSILFKDIRKVQLEGEGSRFPTEVIDFSETPYLNDAGWALEWNPSDLDQNVMGDLRLYINSRHERIRQAVSSSGEEGYDIREAIRFDIARSLIFGALKNPQFVDTPEEFDEGTVGAAVFSMLRLLFPEHSIRDLQSRIEQPQSFDVQLQAKLRLFWTPQL